MSSVVRAFPGCTASRKGGMRPEDALWAARIVARFTDEIVRAVVREGDFRAPEAENLVRTTGAPKVVGVERE